MFDRLVGSVTATGSRNGRRSQVLDFLKEASVPKTVLEIADALGIHPNTARFHLDALIRTGQAEQRAVTRRVPGRPAQYFRAVRRMDPRGARHFRLLAEILSRTLFQVPDGVLLAITAGRDYGRRAGERTDQELAERAAIGPVERLVAMLDQLGFAAERQNGGRPPGEIALRNCPFLELAEQSTKIVCPVHLGLMQGALDHWDAPVTVDGLTPFAEPDLCIAHLATRQSRS